MNTYAFLGAGEFETWHSDIDRALLEGRAGRALVFATAAAPEGYDAIEPEGTFYILVRSPIEDDRRFCDLLQTHDVFVLPGAMFEMPGWFRISVTANDDMVERSLPGFGKAIAEVTNG